MDTGCHCSCGVCVCVVQLSPVHLFTLKMEVQPHCSAVGDEGDDISTVCFGQFWFPKFVLDLSVLYYVFTGSKVAFSELCDSWSF